MVHREDDTAKKRLKEIIEARSLKIGDFILASGLKSSYLFDLKTTLLDPEGANLAADIVLKNMSSDIKIVAGMELGACPLISALCVKSYLVHRPLKACYVRKALKNRGSNNRIEGGIILPEEEVLVLEDVTTTGGSVLESIKVIEEQGGSVKQAYTIVDRQQGAEDNLAKNGVTLHAVFTRSEFTIPS